VNVKKTGVGLSSSVPAAHHIGIALSVKSTIGLALVYHQVHLLLAM